MVTAGELPQRVTVESRTATPSGDGFTETWTAVRRRLSARVAPLQGRDLERARQVDPRISHAVTLRYWRDYRTDLAAGRARLVYHPTSMDADDRVFEIVGAPIDVDEAHVHLDLTCRELQ